MNRLLAAIALLSCGGLCGCLGTSSELEAQPEPDEPAVSLIVQVEPEAFCDDVGTIEFFIQARRIECVDEGPCPELPALDITGTRVSCPAIAPTLLLRVDLRDPGRYLVNLVARDTMGQEQLFCLATAPELADILVDTEDLEANAQFQLVILETPCTSDA